MLSSLSTNMIYKVDVVKDCDSNVEIIFSLLKVATNETTTLH